MTVYKKKTGNHFFLWICHLKYVFIDILLFFFCNKKLIFLSSTSKYHHQTHKNLPQHLHLTEKRFTLDTRRDCYCLDSSEIIIGYKTYIYIYRVGLVTVKQPCKMEFDFYVYFTIHRFIHIYNRIIVKGSLNFIVYCYISLLTALRHSFQFLLLCPCSLSDSKLVIVGSLEVKGTTVCTEL